MRNRKLYHLLALLSEEERKDFAHYLASPLFGGTKTMRRFYGLWVERVWGNENGGEMNAAALLRGSKLKPGRMDKYCSGLSKLLLDFMALGEYRASEQAALEKAADALEKRGAPRRSWDALRDSLQAHIDASPASADRLLRELQFKWKETEARIHTRETRELWKEDFRGLHDAIDRYYQLQKLKLALATANARLIFQQDEDPAKEFVREFSRRPDLDQLPPLTQAYWTAFQLYTTTDSDAHFHSLFTLLQAHVAQFALDEQQELFGYALNYAMQRGNRGEVRYQQYTAALYRELLQEGILLVEGRLPPKDLKNIVVIHCVVGELDWVEAFLETYRDRLTPSSDPLVITYNQGVLAFYRGEHPTAIRLMKQVISQLKDDVFYELDSRIYLLKAYFEHLPYLEMEEIDEMYRMHDSFRIYLSRNDKISHVHKARYGNFLRDFRQFMRLIEKKPLPRERLESLLAEVGEVDLMVNKSWFQDKIKACLEG